MQLFWTEELSVGIEDLDEDHKQLIGMINDLQLEIGEATEPDHFDKQKLERTLANLKVHASAHFEREELCFFQSGYPCQESHRLEHLKLIKRIAESADRIHSTDDPKDAARITLSICDWITGHFYLTDRKFSDHFEKHKAMRGARKGPSRASTEDSVLKK